MTQQIDIAGIGVVIYHEIVPKMGKIVIDHQISCSVAFMRNCPTDHHVTWKRWACFPSFIVTPHIAGIDPVGILELLQVELSYERIDLLDQFALRTGPGVQPFEKFPTCLLARSDVLPIEDAGTVFG